MGGRPSFEETESPQETGRNTRRSDPFFEGDGVNHRLQSGLTEVNLRKDH